MRDVDNQSDTISAERWSKTKTKTNKGYTLYRNSLQDVVHELHSLVAGFASHRKVGNGGVICITAGSGSVFHTDTAPG